MAVKLGTRSEFRNTGAQRHLCEVHDTFQYVPILEGLKALLGHADICGEVSFLSY